MKLAELLKVMRPLGFFGDHGQEHLMQAVRFAHNLGVLQYYEHLSDYIFLQPQWLVDVMSRLVSSEPVQEKRLQAFVSEGNSYGYTQTQRQKDVTQFQQRAIVSTRLLRQCIWPSEEYSPEIFPALLTLAKHFELLVQIPRKTTVDISKRDGDSNAELEGDLLLVPWLLQRKPAIHTEQLLQTYLVGSPSLSWKLKTATNLCRRQRFSLPLQESSENSESGLPAGFFSRLQSYLYRQCAEVLGEYVRDAMVLVAKYPKEGEGVETVVVMVRQENSDAGENDIMLPAQIQFGVIDIISWYAVTDDLGRSTLHTFQIFRKVRASIKLLMKKWPGLVVEQKAPCPRCCDAEQASQGFFDIRELAMRAALGENRVCEQCRNPIAPKDVLLPSEMTRATAAKSKGGPDGWNSDDNDDFLKSLNEMDEESKADEENEERRRMEEQAKNMKELIAFGELDEAYVASINSSGGQTPFRIAFVCTNSNYDTLGKLEKTEADGGAMREILEKRCGFQFGPDAAFFLKDQDGESMKKAMRRFIHFCSKIARPCTTFFYFSGHGHMRDGKNLLAPVDYSAEKAAEAYLKDAVATVTFDIDVDVIGPLNSAELRDPRNINIIMLDCCRSDDLNATYRGGASACSDLRVQWGQSEISSHRGDNDDCVKDSSQFYIAHATRPGTSANEFTFDQYGVFTLKFLEAVRSDQGETRTSLSDMFIATTDAVRFWSLGKLKAGRTQIPQISISATEKVYLVTTPGASLEHKNADIDIGDMFTHAPADGESNLDVGADGNEDSLSFLDCPEFNDDFLDPEQKGSTKPKLGLVFQKGSTKPKLFRCMQAWPRVPFSAHAAERSFHRNLPGLAEFFANQPTLKVLGVRDFPYKNGERLELEREFWILDPNIVEGMEMRLVVIHVHTTSLWQHESLKPVKERNWDRITQINIRHTSDRPMFPHHPQIGVAQGLCYQGRIFDEPRWPEGGRGVALLQRSTAEGWNWQKNKHDVNMDPNNQLCTAAASFQTKVGMDWKVAVRGSIVSLLLKVKDKVTSKGRLFRMLGGAREIGDAQSIVTSPTSEQRLGPSKRLALVIANAKYTEAGAALAKTTADGEDMRDALGQHGYEVTFVPDATKGEMTKQIRAFVGKVKAARPCDSFFFFAGHGKEANGENYLLPIEYRAPNASNQEREEDMAIDLNANLLKELNGNGVGHQHTLNIVMLDCCREDPTNDTFRSRGGFGGAGSLRGLCMNTRGATSRTGSSQFLIAFGSAPGTVCIEYKEDRNGAFTQAFLLILKQKSHLPVETFWKQVTNKVQIRTEMKQKPWVNMGGFTKDFSFALDCAKHGGSTPARQGGSSSSGSISGGSSGGSGSASGGSCGGGGGSSTLRK
jgi:uncharacterized caspase-like protein